MLSAVLVAAAAALSPSPLADARFEGLSRFQTETVRSLARHAPPQGRRVLRLLAPHLVFRPGAAEDLGGGDLVTTEVGARSVRFTVTLAPRTRHGGRFGRHMILHELGHAVDTGLMTHTDRLAWDFAFSGAPRWLTCFPMPPNPSNTRCVPAAEIFADQFAFYANGDRGIRSGYNVPPLLRRAQFDALLRRAVPGRPGTLLTARRVLSSVSAGSA